MYFVCMSALSSCTLKEGIWSCYRWLWAIMHLQGIELRSSRRGVKRSWPPSHLSSPCSFLLILLWQQSLVHPFPRPLVNFIWCKTSSIGSIFSLCGECFCAVSIGSSFTLLEISWLNVSLLFVFFGKTNLLRLRSRKPVLFPAEVTSSLCFPWSPSTCLTDRCQMKDFRTGLLCLHWFSEGAATWVWQQGH